LSPKAGDASAVLEAALGARVGSGLNGLTLSGVREYCTAGEELKGRGLKVGTDNRWGAVLFGVKELYPTTRTETAPRIPPSK